MAKLLKILLVENESPSSEHFIKMAKKAGASRFANDEYDQLKIELATNQQEADEEAGAGLFDIVLLDLNYPAPSPSALIEGPERFPGIRWLPTLRKLQPDAAIVILTKYANSENVLAALRNYGANDFLKKTDRFDDEANRIHAAWKHADALARAERGREEFWGMLRSEMPRVYAESIGILLGRLRDRLLCVARDIEGGDVSLIGQAPGAIRRECKSAWEEYLAKTRELPTVRERTTPVDLSQMLSEMAEIYPILRQDKQAEVTITTYRSDIKFVLHEVFRNAVQFGPRQGPIDVELQRSDGYAAIHVRNKGAFRDELFDRLFAQPVTTVPGPCHDGRGLFLAYRTMRTIGGDVRAINEKINGTSDSIAHVTITVKDLASSQTGD